MLGYLSLLDPGRNTYMGIHYAKEAIYAVLYIYYKLGLPSEYRVILSVLTRPPLYPSAFSLYR